MGDTDVAGLGDGTSRQCLRPALPVDGNLQ